MSFTRRDWALVAETMKKAKPAQDAHAAALHQHAVDCHHLADTFEKAAAAQGQAFDAIRFLRNCGVKIRIALPDTP